MSHAISLPGLVAARTDTAATHEAIQPAGVTRRAAAQPLGAKAPLPAAENPWSGGFKTLTSENDYWVEEIEGQVPAELSGTLFRNGPARNDINGQWFAHWFDGDGMLSAMTFDRGRVRYRNRYVRTRGYVDEQAAVRVLYRGFGTQRPGGVLGNALRRPKNAANTSVVYHAGRLLALWEGGPPTAISPQELATIGLETFGRAVKTFSAHPKIDPRSGELFNFGIEYGSVAKLQIYRIDSSARLSRFAPIELPYALMNHDFALTEKHLIFCFGPILVNAVRLILGLGSFDGELRWDGGKPTRILIVARDGSSPPKWVETEPFFQFHFANAFDENGTIGVDVARYPDFNAIGNFLRNFWRAEWPSRGGAEMTRLTIDPRSGKVDNRPLGGGNAEFPQFNPRLLGVNYRYAYVAAIAPGGGGFHQAINKIDLKTGAVTTCDFSPDGYVGEPIFIEAAGARGEDHGYLVTLVYDADTERTKVAVLDAREVDAKPLAIAYLKHHVPFGFHGFFTRELFGQA